MHMPMAYLEKWNELIAISLHPYSPKNIKLNFEIKMSHSRIEVSWEKKLENKKQGLLFIKTKEHM